MVRCWIGLGGNLGDVPQTFERAIAEIGRLSGSRDLVRSRNFRSAAMGAVAGGEFWNAVAGFITVLPPQTLLRELQRIESACGRTRELYWGPRTLDLDLIYYGDRQLQSPELTVPHPGRSYRRFVLDPLAEIAPDWQDPDYEESVARLQSRLSQPPRQLWLPAALGQPLIDELSQSVISRWPDVLCRQYSPETSPQQGLTVWMPAARADHALPTRPGLLLPANLASQPALELILAAATAAFCVPLPVD